MNKKNESEPESEQGALKLLLPRVRIKRKNSQ